MPTNFPTALDEAREVTSDSRYDVDYMRGVDDQIIAIGTEVVEQRNRTYAVCYPKAAPDGGALSAGCVVALRAAEGAGREPLMVAATAANLGAGAILLGLLTAATPAGQRGRVAVGGVVPSSEAVVQAGSGVYVRGNATTGQAEFCAGGDVLVGIGIAGGAVRVAISTPLSVAGGLASVAMADANVTLTPLQASRQAVVATGALTLARDIVAPLVAGARWAVRNATSGGFAVVFKGATGASVSVPSGQTYDVLCDGTDMVRVT